MFNFLKKCNHRDCNVTTISTKKAIKNNIAYILINLDRERGVIASGYNSTRKCFIINTDKGIIKMKLSETMFELGDIQKIECCNCSLNLNMHITYSGQKPHACGKLEEYLFDCVRREFRKKYVNFCQ